MKKRNNSWMYPFMIIGFIVILTSSCKKEDNTPITPTPTPASTTVTDIDGNVYHTITIGTQTWMLENLRVTHYRNGDPIAHVTDNSPWLSLTTGAYCNYDNSGENGNTYGRLYNWYAVADGPLISPVGWHVPSSAEWTTLIDYLGGLSVAGGKLKEATTTHWSTPNTGATNGSGFTALPGGSRIDNTGVFAYIGQSGKWWTSSEAAGYFAYCCILYCQDATVNYCQLEKRYGFSIRCIKD